MTQGYGDFINRVYSKLPKVSPEGRRLQMIVCSATLHNFEVKKLAVSRLCGKVCCEYSDMSVGVVSGENDALPNVGGS